MATRGRSARQQGEAEVGVQTKADESLRLRAELAEAQLTALVELAEVGVLLLDCEGNVQLVNERFETLFGADRIAIARARTWTDIAFEISKRFAEPEAFQDRWRERLQRISESSVDELVLTQASGMVIERFTRPLLDSSSMPVGRLEIYRDISARKMIQNKLEQTEKLAGLGQLIAGIAHELNNPLTSIMGYAQLLMRKRLSSQVANEARHVYEESDRASRIVKNLLLFAREKNISKEVVDLNHIVERTVALRNYESKMQNISVELELAQALPSVFADAGQLQQIILNLVINAEQAVASASVPAIRIRTTRPDSKHVALEVIDNGIGIEGHVLPHIFDPFFTTKPSGYGTGLGLSIAYSIVQEHGGIISVKSEPYRGAKFKIRLPAVEARTPVGFRATAGSRTQTRIQPRPSRVLVIEDEPTVARLIADALADDGHTVEAVLDARQGIARALRGRYDVLICDLRMPHLDGRAIFKELERQHSPLHRTTLFITGDTLAPPTMEFLESAGVPYLAKPFRVEELRQAVARLVPRESGRVTEMRGTPHDRRKGERRKGGPK